MPCLGTNESGGRDAGKLRRPLLLGHRGCRRGAAENTRAAFDKALRDGCDGFEFDIRLSADFHPVVAHDPRLHGFEIAHASLAQLSSASGEIPCCLQEVLAEYAQRAYLDIELKVAGLEQVTLNLLRERQQFRGVVISSFLPEVLFRLAELQSEQALANGGGPGQSHSCAGDRTPWPGSSPSAFSLGFIFDRRESLRGWEQLPVSHLIPRHDLLSRTMLADFHAAGKEIFVWTVNREPEMRRLAEMGVDGLISDDTLLLSHTFGRNIHGPEALRLR